MVEQALEELDCTACRQGSDLATFLAERGLVECLNQDVVEQAAPRSTDDKAQEKMYSGKKTT